MASETFAYWNLVEVFPSGTGPHDITASGTSPANFLTVIEDDGTIDGSTAIGGAVLLGGATHYYVGMTTDGDPLISTSPDPSASTVYVLSDSDLNGTQVTFVLSGSYAYCFAKGTQIATDGAEQPVETLRIGDLVQTRDGHMVPVKWVGKQTLSTRFGAAERLMPVRFAAGSLGDGLPHSDLTVTADHAMLVDGVLCNASALVNGTSITRVPLAEMPNRFTMYHVETEAHEIILANGAPAETFIDNVSRRAFDNFAEYTALYGEETEMTELPLPRATSARQVPASLKARLKTPNAA